MNRFQKFVIAPLIALSLALAGCATQPFEQLPPNVAPALRWTTDAALQARLLSLDPAHVTDRDVRDVLAKGPTPRIMLLHGGVYPVHLVMESFGAFLTGMGYPEAQIRDPGSGDWSYSPYLQTTQLAGLVAWQYEHDGLHPMLVGHSQGGLSAVRILKDLAGWGGDLRVYNPIKGTLEERTTSWPETAIVPPPFDGPAVCVTTIGVAICPSDSSGFLLSRWQTTERRPFSGLKPIEKKSASVRSPAGTARSQPSPFRQNIKPTSR